MRRKIVFVSASMIFGIWIAGRDAVLAAGILAAASFIALGYHAAEKSEHGRYGRFVLVMLAALLLGSVRFWIADANYKEIIKMADGKAHTYTFVIKSYEPKDDYVELIGRVIMVDGAKIRNPMVLLYCRDNKYAKSGVTGLTAEFRGELTVPEGRRNPNCFDHREYLRSKGIYLTAGVSGLKTVSSRRSISDSIRKEILGIRDGFLQRFPEDSGVRPLVSGLMFGESSGISDETYDAFSMNGTAHVLAVSGLHIGLLYAVFRKLKKSVGSKYISVLFWIMLIVYGTMSLWSVSVIRAAAMIALTETGRVTDRRYDMLTSLGVVALASVIHDPFVIYGMAFQMSYIACVSLSMILPVIQKHVPGIVATPLSVQIGLMPFMIYSFNRISLISVLINIPTVWLAGIILPVCIAGLLIHMMVGALPFLGILLEPFAGVVLTGASLLIQALVWMNEAFTFSGLFSPDTVSPEISMLALIYGIMVLGFSESGFLLRKRKKKREAAKLVAVLLIFSMLAGIMADSDFKNADIVMIDVGQGDALHFRYDTNGILLGEKKDVLIDGGGQKDRNIGKKVLRTYFLKNGSGDVELAYATHLHTDHYQGLVELYQEGLVDRLVTKGRTGDRIWFGKEKDEANYIEIIFPDTQIMDTDDENKNSLIFKVHIKGVTCLVTGDLGEEGELALVEKYRGTDVLDCDILKVCHHGSRFSSSEEFLEAVSPEIALIGVGKNNTYGHPSSEALERLRASGAKVYRTDIDGAIGIDLDGEMPRVSVMRPLE